MTVSSAESCGGRRIKVNGVGALSGALFAFVIACQGGERPWET